MDHLSDTMSNISKAEHVELERGANDDPDSLVMSKEVLRALTWKIDLGES